MGEALWEWKRDYVQCCCESSSTTASGDEKILAEIEEIFADNHSAVHRGPFTKTQPHFHFIAWPPYPQRLFVRILKEKKKILEEFRMGCAQDVTFVIDGEVCAGDRRYLSAISPVFDRMLNGSFVEARQERIELREVESVDAFRDFLLAISTLRIQVFIILVFYTCVIILYRYFNDIKKYHSRKKESKNLNWCLKWRQIYFWSA